MLISRKRVKSNGIKNVERLFNEMNLINSHRKFSYEVFDGRI